MMYEREFESLKENSKTLLCELQKTQKITPFALECLEQMADKIEALPPMAKLMLRESLIQSSKRGKDETRTSRIFQSSENVNWEDSPRDRV